MDTLLLLQGGKPGASALPPAMLGPLLVARCSHFPAGSRVDAHRHARGQFLFAAVGAMSVRTDRRAWLVPPSRALWIPAGVEHAFVAHGDLQLRTLYLSEASAKALPSTCAALEVTPLLRELVLRMTAATPKATGIRMDLALPLVISEIENLPSCRLDLPMPVDPVLQAFCDRVLMEEGHGEPGAPSQAHAKTLYRRFRAETGISYAQWRRQALLLQAVRRLSAGEPVTSVALDLGYQSPSAFSTMFKRKLGYTPREFLPAARD